MATKSKSAAAKKPKAKVKDLKAKKNPKGGQNSSAVVSLGKLGRVG